MFGYHKLKPLSEQIENVSQTTQIKLKRNAMFRYMYIVMFIRIIILYCLFFFSFTAIKSNIQHRRVEKLKIKCRQFYKELKWFKI